MLPLIFLSLKCNPPTLTSRVGGLVNIRVSSSRLVRYYPKTILAALERVYG